MFNSQISKQISFGQSILNESQEFWIKRPNDLIQFELQEEFQVVYRNRLIPKILYLGKHYIKYNEEKFLDIRNLILELIYHPRTSQIGFRLNKGTEKIDVYGDVNEWINRMKKYTIQINFPKKYKILKKLDNENKTFQLFKVRDKLTGLENQVQIYDKNILNHDRQLFNLISQQIELFRIIEHKHLQQLIEIFESTNHLYIISELVEGGSLSQMIQNQQLSEQQIVIIVQQTLDALKELHKFGFIHCDINQESIAFKNDKDIKSLCLINYEKLVKIQLAKRKSFKQQPLGKRNSIKNNENISDLQQLGIVVIKMINGQQYNQYNVPNNIDDIKTILNFTEFSKELQKLLQLLLIIDFEQQLSENNTPSDILQNEIFKQQHEPENFLIKYSQIKNEDEEKEKDSNHNNDDDFYELRPRVHTLPSIQDGPSNRSNSRKDQSPQYFTVKLIKSKQQNEQIKPSIISNKIFNNNNPYQLPKLQSKNTMKIKII